MYLIFDHYQIKYIISLYFIILFHAFYRLWNYCRSITIWYWKRQNEGSFKRREVTSKYLWRIFQLFKDKILSCSLQKKKKILLYNINCVNKWCVLAVNNRSLTCHLYMSLVSMLVTSLGHTDIFSSFLDLLIISCLLYFSRQLKYKILQ